MRRKTQIVLAVTFMVAALVCGFSYIYVSQILRQQVTFARNSAAWINSQLAYLATNAIPDLTSTRVDTSNPIKVRRAIADYLATNLDLNTMLESVLTDWPMIYDAAIVDSDGKAILHTTTEMVGKTVPDRPDFKIVQDAKFRRQLRLVY